MKSDWISVNERLPMIGEIVLTSSSKDGFGVYGFMQLVKSVFDDDELVWHDNILGYMPLDAVNHWQPLPEPPKTEE